MNNHYPASAPGAALEPHSALPAGKLPPALLSELLRGLPTTDPRLLVGPSVGEDAAVIDFLSGQELLLVAKADPITFATDEIGHYAVNVCANDIAVTGANPRFFLPTVLLPAATDPALAQQIFAQIGAACRRIGVVVAGGHSEITPAVNQPVVAGAMLGEVARSRYVRSDGCHIGHVVLAAGTVPIEGASIIARERRADLFAAGWEAAELDEAAQYLHTPGISVLEPALLAAGRGLVSAMHDPTEGGIATGLWEMAAAAGVGLEIDLDLIPVLPLALRLCRAFDLDPLGTIASGALLATAAAADVEPLQRLWRDHGWPSAVIGRILPASEGLVAHRSGQPCPFPRFAVDEITRIF